MRPMEDLGHSHKKVLIVEADAYSPMLAAKVCLKKGLLVKSAKDGVEALSLWKEEAIELLLMELNLHYINGYEASNQLR